MLKAKVLNPKRIRRKKISCAFCKWTEYSRRDYEILYDNRKLVFFQFPLGSKYVSCHDCLVASLAKKIKKNETCIKVLVTNEDEEYIISVEKE